jgi:hypothetical protein
MNPNMFKEETGDDLSCDALLVVLSPNIGSLPLNWGILY